MSLEKIFYPWMDKPRLPIIQGGMGAGISLSPLAVAVAEADAIGTISSVGLNLFTSKRVNEKLNTIDAVAREVSDTKKLCGFAAVNIMAKLVTTYEDSIEGAVKGGANMIVVGAGLPTHLPQLVEKFHEKYYGTKKHNIGIVPIVSSAQVLELIMHRYWKSNTKEGYKPDMIILEGPKAGGHIGWSYKAIEKSGENFLKEYDLFDVLLTEVLNFLNKNNYNIPVIVAGGIRNNYDVLKALKLGAKGVQFASPLIVADESGASEEFKQATIDSKNEDILLGTRKWGSAAGYPFKHSRKSPLIYELSDSEYFCICRALICATPHSELTNNLCETCPEGYIRSSEGICPAMGNIINKALYTMGSEVNSITKRAPAAEIIRELIY